MNNLLLDEKITLYSEDIYQYLLQFRSTEPNFSFWLRQRNSTLSKIDRLGQGFWFQGSNYIFISPYKRGDSKNKTRTIGFVVHPDRNETWCALEIASPSETDQQFIDCYEEIIRTFNAQAFIRRGVFRMRYPSQDIKQSLKKFIEQDKPIIDSIIKKHNLYEHFYITPAEFEKLQYKTESYRRVYKERIELSIEDIELGEYEEGEERNSMKAHKYRERNRKFVTDFKNKYRTIRECPGCRKDLQSLYGIPTIQLLELHHVTPFSKTKEKTKIREDDAILLCPVCHRAIHKYMTVEKSLKITLTEFQGKLEALKRIR